GAGEFPHLGGRRYGVVVALRDRLGQGRRKGAGGRTDRGGTGQGEQGGKQEPRDAAHETPPARATGAVAPVFLRRTSHARNAISREEWGISICVGCVESD